MLEFEGRQIPNELKEIVDPKRAVLLVWDMQNDQAGGSFNKDALIRNAPPLIAAAAQAGIKTVYTRQTPFLWERRGTGLDSPRNERSEGRSSKQTKASTLARQLRLADHGTVQAGGK
jgi:nicotinamidase-related amidase